MVWGPTIDSYRKYEQVSQVAMSRQAPAEHTLEEVVYTYTHMSITKAPRPGPTEAYSAFTPIPPITH